MQLQGLSRPSAEGAGPRQHLRLWPQPWLRRQGGWGQVPSAHSQQGRSTGVGHGFLPNCRASSFYSPLRPSHPRGHCLSPPQLSLPGAFSPSEDLHTGRVRYPGGRGHTAPQGCSASLSSCISLGPKTQGLDCTSRGKGAEIPSCNAPIHCWCQPPTEAGRGRGARHPLHI